MPDGENRAPSRCRMGAPAGAARNAWGELAIAPTPTEVYAGAAKGHRSRSGADVARGDPDKRA